MNEELEENKKGTALLVIGLLLVLVVCAVVNVELLEQKSEYGNCLTVCVDVSTKTKWYENPLFKCQEVCY